MMPTSSKRIRKRVNPAWKEWSRSLKKLRDLRRQYKNTPSIHGSKWQRKMVAHVDRQIKEYCNHEPSKHLE